MLLIFAVSFVLVLAACVCQSEIMRGAVGLRKRLGLTRRVEMMVLIAATFLAHGINVVLYAFAFAATHHHPAFGELAGRFDSSWQDFLYFSLTSYTSLGFGDVYPLGDLRILAGVEALNGLVLIAWSATFTFLAVERGWSDED